MTPEIRDDRQMRALTGVPTEKLTILANAFATALAEKRSMFIKKNSPQGNASENWVVDKKASYPLYKRS